MKPTPKKLPSGNWRVQLTINGKRKSFTAPTKREVLFLASSAQNEGLNAQIKDETTVGDKLDRYILKRAENRSPATIQGYKVIRNHSWNTIIDMPVADLTEDIVQNAVNELARDHSPKTVKNAFGLLHSACGFDFDIILPQRPPKIYRTPSPEQVASILKNTEGTVLEVPVLLAVWCGLRASEVRALKWENVSIDTITVSKAMVKVNNEYVEKQTKTNGSTRIIHITPFLHDKLMAHYPNDSEYLCPELQHMDLTKRFKVLTGDICNFHELRHVNASVMIHLGIPDNVAMERGGWETESIYKKTYAQTMKDDRVLAAELIDSFYQSLMGSTQYIQ